MPPMPPKPRQNWLPSWDLRSKTAAEQMLSTAAFRLLDRLNLQSEPDFNMAYNYSAQQGKAAKQWRTLEGR
jgi:hypothetical protein